MGGSASSGIGSSMYSSSKAVGALVEGAGAASGAVGAPVGGSGGQQESLLSAALSPPPLRTGFVASLPVFSSVSTPSPEARSAGGSGVAAAGAAAAVVSPSGDTGSVYSDGFDEAAPSPALSELSPLGPTGGAAAGRAAAHIGAGADPSQTPAGQGGAALALASTFEIAEADIEEDIGQSYGGESGSGDLGAF